MAHRLLPFRQYDENDVINLYALDADGFSIFFKLMNSNDDGINADGVLVQVQDGNLTENDVISVGEDSRYMASYNSPVGRNPYPTNPLKVAPAASGNAILGVTLRQTLAVDENGESLLFNPVKKDELQAVLSGQTVPVLTKGVITVGANAVNGVLTPGDRVGQAAGSSNVGKFAKVHVGSSNEKDIIGQVLATGFRGGNKDDNYGGINADQQSGNYYVIKLDC